MEALLSENQTEIRCPYCGNDALYRYGHTTSKKQRYLCLICEKQFTLGNRRAVVNHKPLCPVCGSVMHLYRRERAFLRFRCSNYPVCRTYKKVTLGGEL
jgi:ssDNA-binding Zn-finger/Zn-ribbon topoisomerase 1